MAMPPEPPPSSLRMIEDDLTCSICYCLFKEPKDLACPHVFCLHCLEKWARNRPTVECPECRRTTVVPNGDLTSLRTNLRLKNMTEKYQTHGRKISSVPRCDIHEGEAKHFFCETCKVKVCRYCLVVDHPTTEHDVRSVGHSVKQKKHEVEKLLDGVNLRVGKCEAEKANLKEMLNQIDTDIACEYSKIDERIQAIIFDAQAKGNALKLHVRRNFEHQLDHIGERMQHLEERMQTLRDVHATTQTLLQDTEDHRYMEKHVLVIRSLQTVLRESQADKTPPSTESPCIFHPGQSIPEALLLGQLTVKRELQLLAEFGKGSCRKAQGISSNPEGSITIADSCCGRVCVYRFEHGEYRRKFCLGTSKVPPGKLVNPSDVAIGNDDRFYVTDRSKAVVNIYLPSGHFERAFSTRAADDKSSSAKPACVATAPTGEVVVGESDRNAITIHGPNGELLRTFHTNIQGVNQIATNGSQIAYVKTDTGRVCVIDFRSGETEVELSVAYATAACFEDQSGSLLIAKAGQQGGGGTIEQYCLKTHKYMDCLAKDLFMPLAMTITSNDKLAVADCSSVKVYNIV